MSNSASSLYDFGFSDLMSNSPIQALGSDCIRYSTNSCRKNGEVNIFPVIPAKQKIENTRLKEVKSGL